MRQRNAVTFLEASTKPCCEEMSANPGGHFDPAKMSAYTGRRVQDQRRLARALWLGGRVIDTPIARAAIIAPLVGMRANCGLAPHLRNAVIEFIVSPSMQITNFVAKGTLPVERPCAHGHSPGRPEAGACGRFHSAIRNVFRAHPGLR